MKTKHINNTNRNDPQGRDPVRGKLEPLIALFRQGKKAQAKRGLVALARQHPRSAPVLGYLAGVYFQTDDLENAAEYFRRTTELSPTSELASVGLFHSLWGLGMKQVALDEMRRFLSISESSEYDLLLHDLAADGQIVPRMDPAQAV